VLQRGALLKQVISTLRDTRNKNQLKPKDAIKLFIQTNKPDVYQAFLPVLAKQIQAESVLFTSEAQAKTIVVAIEQDKFYIESKQEVDSASMRAQLEKDLTYQQNFLASVVKKLSNERFVQNARPDVIELERKKQADTEARIRTIEESLNGLV
jgi:valyl-tRNA synthetase